MGDRVLLALRAIRDLRGTGHGQELSRIREALERLEAEAQDLDVKALASVAPWLRLRVGDYRVLYRPLDSEGTDTGALFVVARIVHRRDLERAVRSLE